MAKNVIERIATDLTSSGYSLTSFSELGLEFDEVAVTELVKIVGQDVYSEEAANLAGNTKKTTGMIIAQGVDTLRLGTALVIPVVESLFACTPDVLGKWALYAVNRYDAGGRFDAHMDSIGGTVVVTTLSGHREFDIYRRDSDQHETKPETFRVVEHTFDLGPGSIMLLNGELDPPHAARCIEPSIAAVVDVAQLLRVY